MWSFHLFPESASSIAPDVDALYWALVALTAVFSLGIFASVMYFAVKYRRGNKVDRSNPPASSHKLELVWIIVPLIISLVLFIWASAVYFKMYRAPADAAEVMVVGKQWMWKLQSPNGQREINELHVPIGKPVKLVMTSQDVIHSFYIPDMRVKQDVLPGRYTSLWFTPTKVGTFHLFCAEYCGTQHSGMIGQIVVMEPDQYEAWMSGGTAGEAPAAAGQRLITQLGCATCHVTGAAGRAPAFEGLFGKTQQLQGGSTAVVDEAYIRESILQPQAKIVQGFEPIMPSFAGQVSEEAILQIIAYIKSLGSSTVAAGATAPTTGAASTATSAVSSNPVEARSQGSGTGTDQNTTGSSTTSTPGTKTAVPSSRSGKK